MIWKTDGKNSSLENSLSNDVVLADEKINIPNKSELEEKLENILSKIEGVGVAKVMITYSQTSQTIAMYNEDNKVSDTKEEASRWWDKKYK